MLLEPKEIPVERSKKIYEGIFEVAEDSETGTKENPIRWRKVVAGKGEGRLFFVPKIYSKYSQPTAILQ